MAGKLLQHQIGSFTKIPAEAADQFFSQHTIIYRPTHLKNRTHTGGGQQWADGYLDFLAALTNSWSFDRFNPTLVSGD